MQIGIDVGATKIEIADFAIYLASDESTFTTGNTFSVDGGMTI